MEQVGALPAGCQGLESGFQGSILVQLFPELVCYSILLQLFERYVQACSLDLNRFKKIGFNAWFQFQNLFQACKTRLSGGLYGFRVLSQPPF